MLRELKKLRKSDPNWTIKRLQEMTETFHVSESTIARVLHEQGYRYRNCRKKGLLNEKDHQCRLAFARKMIKENDHTEFWTDNVAFYFDGVSFTYKKNPKAQAIAPTGRVWRKRNEGMSPECCTR